jgi:hypothetical protein
VSDPSWWQSFFDSDYLRLWGTFTTEARTQQEVAGIWALLGLEPGCRLGLVSEQLF